MKQRTILGVAALLATIPGSIWADCVFTNDGAFVGSNVVSSFQVNDDGTLTPTVGSPFSAAGPTGLIKMTETLAQLGSFLYAVNSGDGNQDGSLAGFFVNADCTLTALPGSPWPLGRAGIAAVEIDPSRRLLFTSSIDEGGVDTFHISPSGVPASTGFIWLRPSGGLADLVISPNHEWLYVSYFYLPGVGAYKIKDDGRLDPLAGSPFAIVGMFFNGLAVSPDGRYLYGVDGRNSKILGFSVEVGGELQLLDGSPWSTVGSAPFAGSDPVDTLVMPDGRHLIVSNRDSTLSIFEIETDGNLVEVTGSPFMTAAKGGHGLVAHPSGAAFYLTNGGLGSFEPWGRNSVTAYGFAPKVVAPLANPLTLSPLGSSGGVLYFQTVEIPAIPTLSKRTLCALAAILLLMSFLQVRRAATSRAGERPRESRVHRQSARLVDDEPKQVPNQVLPPNQVS